MPAERVDADLGARLDELKREHGVTVKIDEIDEVVRSLLATVSGDLSSSDLELFGELEKLSHYIEAAKAEIAALRPDEVKEEFLPKATDELDAIVEATAEATHAIMDATEAVEEVMDAVGGEAAEKLMDATTKIYEACGFQDITGQRITKVVGALQHIEEKIDALVEAFGAEIERYKQENPAPAPEPEEEEKPVADEDLLQGPQLPTSANTQDEIDALLASFD